ncbi:MAG TPA: ferrochelatase [Candidatus Saccharimonadales bacterium]|nr:ferrochelatase [Candidatus Saccharimonadales bacterium]
MNSRSVLLLTYGEPPTPAFGDQLRYSWRILLGLTRSVAPIPAPLLPVIALKRGWTRNRMWSAEKYGSPLEAITGRQAALVRAELERLEPGTRWEVRPAYEFRDPLLVDAIRALPDGAPVDVVPMYAACSAFTHDLSRRLLAGLPVGALGRRAVEVLPPLPEPQLAAVMVNHLLVAMDRLKLRGGADCALVLAAHGTLLRPPRPFETGRAATERLYGLVRDKLHGHFGRVQNCWLNHVYGGEWTRPAADEALADLAREGFRRVVYFPYGFLADNAESELEGRQVLRTQPGMEAHHLPCLNEDPALAKLIARQVTGRLALAAPPAG